MKPELEIQLSNRAEPLQIQFYLACSVVLHDYEWGRIYLYSGLGGATIAKRFASRITEGLFTRVIAELRHEFQLPNLSVKPMTELARRGGKQVSRYRRSRTSDRAAVGLGISDKDRDQDRKLRQALLSEHE